VSGPIVRKYGFPNFENIFGKRELEHGVDDETPSAESTTPQAPTSPVSSRMFHGDRASGSLSPSSRTSCVPSTTAAMTAETSSTVDATIWNRKLFTAVRIPRP